MDNVSSNPLRTLAIAAECDTQYDTQCDTHSDQAKNAGRPGIRSKRQRLSDEAGPSNMHGMPGMPGMHGMPATFEQLANSLHHMTSNELWKMSVLCVTETIRKTILNGASQKRIMPHVTLLRSSLEYAMQMVNRACTKTPAQPRTNIAADSKVASGTTIQPTGPHKTTIGRSPPAPAVAATQSAQFAAATQFAAAAAVAPRVAQSPATQFTAATVDAKSERRDDVHQRWSDIPDLPPQQSEEGTELDCDDPLDIPDLPLQQSEEGTESDRDDPLDIPDLPLQQSEEGTTESG